MINLRKFADKPYTTETRHAESFFINAIKTTPVIKELDRFLTLNNLWTIPNHDLATLIRRLWFPEFAVARYAFVV